MATIDTPSLLQALGERPQLWFVVATTVAAGAALGLGAAIAFRRWRPTAHHRFVRGVFSLLMLLFVGVGSIVLVGALVAVAVSIWPPHEWLPERGTQVERALSRALSVLNFRTATTTTADSADEVMDRGVTLSAPAYVQQGTRFEVRYTITPQVTLAKMTSSGKVKNTPVRPETWLTHDMTVTLSGQGLTVHPDGPQPQYVRYDSNTTWRFDVTPTSSGSLTVKADLTAYVRLGQEKLPVQKPSRSLVVWANFGLVAAAREYAGILTTLAVAALTTAATLLAAMLKLRRLWINRNKPDESSGADKQAPA